MNPDDWDDINTLLTYLRSFEVVDLVRAHYEGKHGNSAPASLLEEQIERIRQILSKGMIR